MLESEDLGDQCARESFLTLLCHGERGVGETRIGWLVWWDAAGDAGWEISGGRRLSAGGTT